MRLLSQLLQAASSKQGTDINWRAYEWTFNEDAANERPFSNNMGLPVLKRVPTLSFANNADPEKSAWQVLCGADTVENRTKCLNKAKNEAASKKCTVYLISTDAQHKSTVLETVEYKLD